MKAELPEASAQFAEIARKLENHYREMQDVEFTIEKGKLWLLQTRNGKRTAQAAVRIAVDMVEEGIISREEAVLRVSPEQVDFFLHPQFDPAAVKKPRSGRQAGDRVTSRRAPRSARSPSTPTSPSAGRDGKSSWCGRRPPDDVHGMLAARGILISRGGRTSHAALVARQFGKPAVVGVASLEIDLDKRQIHVAGKTLREGDWVSIDGTVGSVFAGQLPTVVPDIKDPYLEKLLGWADGMRRLQVWANADYPVTRSGRAITARRHRAVAHRALRSSSRSARRTCSA
jgi:pyruvate,orthophosphate dikinase